MRKSMLILFIVMALAGGALADGQTIRIAGVTDRGLGEEIGTIVAEDTRFGLLLTPQLAGLPPGIHGFHVHQHPDCGSMIPGGEPLPAAGAGGHFDPLQTGRHEGPYGNGHLGDLPFLFADREGRAMLPVLAPRLKVADLRGRSLMIHAGGDNYSDLPEKLGGGGGRIGCGVVK
ncbi:MAG: superoxide dismutase [Cu-Zn] SodC [Deltaproteobacteria bacterium]|nr:superoxide dismutase [Cu-Zn] SodC [Deltaproteobacteria bacterium]